MTRLLRLLALLAGPLALLAGPVVALTMTTAALGNPHTEARGGAVGGIPSSDSGPTITLLSSTTIPSSAALMFDVCCGVKVTLSVDASVVESFAGGDVGISYAPPAGWSPGKHSWQVTATDYLEITNRASGMFTTPGCRVPRVIGRTPTQARTTIIRHLCSVGRVSYSHSRDRLRGRVIAQHPHAGKLLRLHASVSFTIGVGHRT